MPRIFRELFETGKLVRAFSLSRMLTLGNETLAVRRGVDALKEGYREFF